MKLLLPFLFAFLVSDVSDLRIHDDLKSSLDPNMRPFYFGVASGDPTQSAVILWTKLTLDDATNKQVKVHYVMSLYPDCRKPVKKGTVITGPDSDYTVKTDATGLQENTLYYYRFEYKGKKSIIGQTKTLPANPDSLSLAFASCSNYEWGYFNNYRFIAEDTSIDLVVHLGDYIYEHAPGDYGDTTIGRKHIPAKEITTLHDYRTRYAQYRLDPDLMKAHQMKPFVTTWDDHELANDAYVEGARNHQSESEGTWGDRKAAAIKAYEEWMPVREKEQEHKDLYRSFQVGDLLNLIMLDTRVAGRSVQCSSMFDSIYLDPSRTILGQPQYNWFSQELQSKAQWKIIGNQVPFGHMYVAQERFAKCLYLDGWDGYPIERERIIQLLENKNIKDVVWITGDYHSSFAMENDREGTADDNDNVSVEFVVTSITSANEDEYTKDSLSLAHIGELYGLFNPHLRYVNYVDHGYAVLTVTKSQARVRFYYASTIRSRDAVKRMERQFVVRAGESKLREQ